MGQYLTKIEREFINQCLVNNSALKRILDVGGGSGRHAVPVYKMGYKVIVTEVNPVPLRKLQEKEQNIPSILVGTDANLFPFKDSSFDCVLCIQINPLVEGTDWSECSRVLRNGGIVIFVTSNKTPTRL